MREKFSVLFYCLATILVAGHVIQAVAAMTHRSSNQAAYYRVVDSKKTEKETDVVIDYKRLAELNAETSRNEGW